MLGATLRELFRTTPLVPPGERVLVAWSGGPDSTALLFALLELRAEFEFEVCAAHLNHLLRGAESDADQLWCAEIARSLDIPFRSRRIDVAAVARERGRNLEETARELRYGFLREAAMELEAARIAVAHTADDQVETMLDRLVRGAGPEGLRGMRRQRGNIIRPLLRVTRHEVMAFLDERLLRGRHDSSNEDERYRRVFLRRRVIPALIRLNPSITETFATTAELLGDEDDFLNELAEGVAHNLAHKREDGLYLPAAEFVALPAALQRRVLRRLLLRLTGSLRGVSFRQVEAIRALAAGTGPGAELRGVRAVPATDGICLNKIETTHVISYNYTLSAGDGVQVKEIDKSYTLSIIGARPGVDFSQLSGPGKAFLDADLTGGTVEIRNWRPGDRYQPLGAPGRQKLQDLFTNAKISRSRRIQFPVFLAGGAICWVRGMRIAEEFRISERTTRILVISEEE